MCCIPQDAAMLCSQVGCCVPDAWRDLYGSEPEDDEEEFAGFNSDEL